MLPSGSTRDGIAATADASRSIGVNSPMASSPRGRMCVGHTAAGLGGDQPSLRSNFTGQTSGDLLCCRIGSVRRWLAAGRAMIDVSIRQERRFHRAGMRRSGSRAQRMRFVIGGINRGRTVTWVAGEKFERGGKSSRASASCGISAIGGNGPNGVRRGLG